MKEIYIYNKDMEEIYERNVSDFIMDKTKNENIEINTTNTFTGKIYTKIAIDNGFMSFLNVSNYLKIGEEFFYILEMEKNNNEREQYITIRCNHISGLLQDLVWDNEFDNKAVIEFYNGITCYAGFVYNYDGQYYKCIKEYVADSFVYNNFIIINNFINNYMQNTNPLEVVSVLLNYGINEPFHNFIVGDFVNAPRFDFTFKQNSDYLTVLKDIQDLWGGEFIFNNNIINYVIESGTDKTQTVKLKYGTNTKNITQQINYKNICNRIIGQGRNGLTLEEVDGNKYVQDMNSILNYGLKTKKISYDVSTVWNLETLMNRDLNKIKKPDITYQITFLDNINYNIKIGDKINIEDTIMGINTDLRVVSYTKRENDMLADIVVNSQSGTLKKLIRERQEELRVDFNDLKLEIIDMKQSPKNNYELLKIIQEDVISTNTLHAMYAQIKDLEVDTVRTNIMQTAAHPQVNPEPQSVVNYIIIKGNHIYGVREVLDLTETIQMETASGFKMYWTAIDGPQQFKYITINPPNFYDKSLVIGTEEYNAFRVMRYKSVSVGNKFEYGFLDDSGEFLQFFGAGTDPSGLTNKGRGFQKKFIDGDNTGLEVGYYNSNGHKHSIKFDETGVNINQGNFKNRGIRNITITTEANKNNYTHQNGDLILIVAEGV